MPRPLWTAREIIELTYKRSIHALLQSTVNLYLFHKSDQAFAEEVAERRGGFSYRRHIELICVPEEGLTLKEIRPLRSEYKQKVQRFKKM